MLMVVERGIWYGMVPPPPWYGVVMVWSTSRDTQHLVIPAALVWDDVMFWYYFLGVIEE
jgi:hypothetical protein